MAFLLLFLSSFFFKPTLSAIVFEDEAPYLCEGNVPYNKAPIKWYYNKTSRFCLAVRGGCQSQTVPKAVYDSIEDCIDKEFASGYTKSGRGSCWGEYTGKVPVLFEYGAKKTKSPYLMNRCYPEERVCPDGSGCFFDPKNDEGNGGIATCCSLTQAGANMFSTKYSKSLAILA